MYSRLSPHQLTSKIPIIEQYGFREWILAKKAALRLTDSVFKSISQKIHVGETFCDLTKAFVCTNEEIFF